jgi:hypothetical protein
MSEDADNLKSELFEHEDNIKIDKKSNFFIRLQI